MSNRLPEGSTVAFIGLGNMGLPMARRLAANATARERMHVDALEAWIAGDLERLFALWEQILAAHPTDVLAFRLSHYKYFWTGRARDMLASVERIAPKWGSELPGYGAMLGCRCFALEECGDYGAAEPAGREAIEIDPADLWAAHAVAHVMEMQGRQRDGIAWLEGLERHWDGANQLRHHLWWHRALFHYEQREFDRVLALYDRRFRDLASPLTQAQPDFIIDIQNAASMLFRLERQGIDVGDRWIEIADKAEQRIGDCLSVFTLPHWMMALAATGREDVARRMLAGMQAYAEGRQSNAPVVTQIAIPISEAVLAHRRGSDPAVVLHRAQRAIDLLVGGTPEEADRSVEPACQLIAGAGLFGQRHQDRVCQAHAPQPRAWPRSYATCCTSPRRIVVCRMCKGICNG